MPGTKLPESDHCVELAVAARPAARLTGAARELIDIRLQVVGRLSLTADIGHVVAGVFLREEHAEGAVAHQVGDEHALPAAPGPLDPLVIHLLVRQRVVRGPVGEGRVADGVVRGERVGALGDILQESASAVGVMVGQSLSASAIPAVLKVAPQNRPPPNPSLEKGWLCASMTPRTSPVLVLRSWGRSEAPRRMGRGEWRGILG